jgi:hypothetical protein
MTQKIKLRLRLMNHQIINIINKNKKIIKSMDQNIKF